VKFITDMKTKIRAKYQALAATAKDRYARIESEALRLKDLAFSEQYNNYFAAVAFVPFVGWLIPLYLKKDDPFCQEQGKAGFYLSFIFTSLALALIFISIFFSRDWHIARFVNAILVYLVYAVYFGFCAYGIRESIRNRRAELVDRIPLVAQLRAAIEL